MASALRCAALLVLAASHKSLYNRRDELFGRDRRQGCENLTPPEAPTHGYVEPNFLSAIPMVASTESYGKCRLMAVGKGPGRSTQLIHGNLKGTRECLTIAMTDC